MAPAVPSDRKGPLEAVNHGFNGLLAGLAGVSLLAMMTVIVGNMFLRAFATPFAGAFETVGWLAAITTALALGYTQIHKGHVDIDLVVRLLPPTVQRILRVLVALASAAFFVLLAWRLAEMAGRLREVGTVSEALRVPFHHFVYLVALGALGLAVALVADLIDSVRALRGQPADEAAGADEPGLDGHGAHQPDGDG